MSNLCIVVLISACTSTKKTKVSAMRVGGTFHWPAAITVTITVHVSARDSVSYTDGHQRIKEHLDQPRFTFTIPISFNWMMKSMA